MKGIDPIGAALPWVNSLKKREIRKVQSHIESTRIQKYS